MSEKPILFNTEMVRAILDGRKTQTRRLVKEDKRGQWVAVNNARNHEYGASVPCYLHREVSVDDKSRNIMYPKYDVGDILWVRETWCRVGEDVKPIDLDLEQIHFAQILYKADGIDLSNIGKWRPSIHMPKEAARIFLRVAGVRVERLQEITEADAMKEGFEPVPCGCSGKGVYGCTDCNNTGLSEPALLGFVDTWNNIYSAKGHGWEQNPWVWVIEFERVEKPDEL